MITSHSHPIFPWLPPRQLPSTLLHLLRDLHGPHHPAAAMSSLHSSVGSKSTDPHLPFPSATGGANLRGDVASSSSFVVGSSSLVIHSSWITRLRSPLPPPPPPPPPRPLLPRPPTAEDEVPASAAGSTQLRGTASTGESRTREQEVAQEPGRGAAAVAGFGPFQVISNKRRRLLLGRSHKKLQEHHGAAAAAGVPDKEALLADGCFPILQKMGRVGDVCRGEQVAVRDRNEEEEEEEEKLQVEDGAGKAMGASGRGLLSAAAAASSQSVGSGSAPWPRLQGFW